MALPLRRLAPQCFRQGLQHAPSAPFCVSARRTARQRPAAIRRARSRSARPDAAGPAREDSRVAEPLEPAPDRVRGPRPETRSPAASSGRSGRGDAPPTARPRDAPEAADGQSSALLRALRDVATDKQSLASYHVVRHGPSRPLSTKASNEETRQLAAAERFFQHGCQFLYSAESFRHHAINDHVPEIVLLGASNVGKSSFLNALVGRSGAARISQKPGHTTVMNAYGVGPPPPLRQQQPVPADGPRPSGKAPGTTKSSGAARHSLVLVDTPGYGFRSQSSWGAAIVRYLEARRMLRGAVVLLSSEKQRLLPDDAWLLSALARLGVRTLVVLTKADKARRHDAWPARCAAMADAVLGELRSIDESVAGGKWRAASAGAPTDDIYITSAGMNYSGKLGNGGGVGGVRATVLQMAGFALHGHKMGQAPERIDYGGPVVPFDEIEWR